LRWGILHLSQFGSQFAGPQSQTHALAANHSCVVRHNGQKVLLKKTGMERKAAGSMCMPVEMAFSVLGQRIMTSPIQFSLTLLPSLDLVEHIPCDVAFAAPASRRGSSSTRLTTYNLARRDRNLG
jgi:hypothetical protein